MKMEQECAPRVTHLGVTYPWQCDSMGHVTTRCYMAMFDDASLHFLRELGFDFSLLTTQRIGWADVRHVIEYRRELKDGMLIKIESRPTKIGNTSLEYRHDLRNAQTEELHANMVARTVQFDLQSREAIPLLETLRERALQWLQPGTDRS